MRIEVLDGPFVKAALPLADIWEYPPAQFEALVRLSDGCGRVALDRDRALGMAFGFPWGGVGWIGAVLVRPEARGHGLGKEIVGATIEALSDHGCTTIKLYATPKAVGLYRRLGFVGESEFIVAYGGARRGRAPRVVPLTDHLDAALALDAQVFPGDRSRLVRDLAREHPSSSLVVLDGRGDVAGYGIARPAPDGTAIGPIVARGGDAHVAEALVDGLLMRAPEGQADVVYPRAAWAARSAWECRGFVTVDTPLEMRLGPVVEEDRGAIIATGGQELG